jgi:hypothetical protein
MSLNKVNPHRTLPRKAERPQVLRSQLMTIHAPEIIDFLDQHWCARMAAHEEQSPLGSTPEESLCKLQELRHAYLSQLESLPREQVEALAFEALCVEDLARPFHGFATEADYSHFGRCACLTAYEVVALSMGKDPRRVTWAMVRLFVGHSLFANEFANRLDRIERAILWGELPKLFSPLQFLTWAHQYKMSVPDAFVQNTFVRGEPIQYWHELCVALHEKLVATTADLELERAYSANLSAENEAQSQTFDDWLKSQDEIARLTAEHEARLSALQAELAEVREQNTTLHAQIRDDVQTQTDKLSTTERKSLLTMVIASATDVYGFDPADSKSPVPKQIVDAAVRIGLQMTDDTVRKWLKEATKLKGFSRIHKTPRKPKSGKPKPSSV